MTGSTILTSEDTGGLGAFLVLQCLSLAGGVASIKFRLELLVGCLTAAPLITFDFAYDDTSISFVYKIGLYVEKMIPLARSFKALFEACLLL